MDSSRSDESRIVLAIAWRAALVAILLFVVIQLLWTTRLYATMTLAVAVAAAIVVNLSRVISNVSQVTETQSVRHAVRVQHHQLLDLRQTLLDTVAAVLIVVLPDGRITLANRAARHLARIPVSRLEEIVGIGADAARQMLSLAPGAREILRFADGRRMYVAVSGFTAPGHGPQRLLALQRVAGELDTVELGAWQDMAHVLVHEIMNSLTPIASLSESLEMLLQQRMPIDAEIATTLEIIKRRSYGLMDFVARYRAVAEVPAPRQQRVEAAQFLQGIDVLLAPEIMRRGISYRVVTDPPELCFSADPHLLEQAVINLMRNAADSVANLPDPLIGLSCRLRDGWLAIEVRDNGAGVPEGLRDQIFVPFFTTKAAGSGIGLNVARQVALSHRGRLELRHNEPRGSIFTLLLPSAVNSPAEL